MEDGEIQDGFLGEEEMRSRKALAAAHGDEGTSVSWVEAVLLGAGRVAPVDPQENSDDPDEGEPEESAAVSLVVLCSRWLVFLVLGCKCQLMYILLLYKVVDYVLTDSSIYTCNHICWVAI